MAGSESDVFDMLGASAGPGPAPKGGGAPAPAPGGSDDDTVFNMLGPQAPPPTPAGAPPAAAGPPRLRGQRMTPPPPAPRPPPHPGAPAAPAPPPADPSWGQVAQGAVQNFLPSAWDNIKQTISPFLPQNYGQDWQGIKALARGVGSKTGLLIPANAAQKAADEAPLNAVGQMYVDRYGSLPGFKRTLMNNPFAPISDAAAVASLAGGGEGLLAKVPDAAEAALMAGAGAARQGGALSNALLNTAVTVPGAMRAAGKVASGAGRVVQNLDPGVAALNATGAVARKTAPIALGAVRHGVGGGLGAAAGSMIPGLGHMAPYAGMQAGHYIAGKLIPHSLPAWVDKGAAAISRVPGKLAPVAGALAGTQPDTGGAPGPSAAPGGAPGHGPTADEAPPAAAPGALNDPGPSADPRERFRAMYPHFAAGFTDDQLDALMQAPELKGLFDAQPAAAPAPSSGLQGTAPAVGDPGNVGDVIRQAEGGYNQPVGFHPNSGVSARGAFQMIDGTYANNLRKYHPEIVAQIGNGPAAINAFRNTSRGWALNETMGRQMVGDEMNKLKQEGIAPTADAVGTLHMLGNTKLLHADPNTPIEQVTTAGQRNANAGIFRNIRTAGDYLNWMHRRNATAAAQLQPRSAYAADGGRVGRADGGNVIDMTEALMRRAEAHHKATQQATKPLLGIDDSTIAKALRVAQAGI